MNRDFNIESILGSVKHGAYDARSADLQGAKALNDAIEAHFGGNNELSSAPTSSL